MVRVNELLKREISDLLHTRFQGRAVYITITGVQVSSDLKTARVYYSVLGTEEQRRASRHFFKTEGAEIRHQVGKRVVLKYLPALSFVYDDSIERGLRLNELIDQLEQGNTAS